MFPVDNKYLEGYLQNAFFNDPSFGVKRNTGWLEFASHGCDYCFWMIHYRSIHPMMNLILYFLYLIRNRQRRAAISETQPISTKTELDKPNAIDTNIVCM